MPEYRFYCLYEGGTIGYGTHLEVSDLTAAIDAAHDICATHPAGPFVAIEIWHHGKLVYPLPKVGVRDQASPGPTAPHRKRIELFSAGCSVCNEVAEIVRHVAGQDHDIEICDMHDEKIAERARRLNIHRLPSIVVDGEVAQCFTEDGPDEAALRQAVLSMRNWIEIPAADRPGIVYTIIGALQPDAHIGAIQREIGRRYQKEVSYGWLRNALNRLEVQGFVRRENKRHPDPEADASRNHREAIFYYLTGKALDENSTDVA